MAGAAFAPIADIMAHFVLTRTTSSLALTLAVTFALPLTADAQAPRAVVSGTPRRIIVSNERSHDLTVLDGTTLEIIATIPVPGRARGVRVTPDGRHALVALSDDRPQTPGPNDATYFFREFASLIDATR